MNEKTKKQEPKSRRAGPIVSIVSAMASDQVIGIENQLPWHLPEDLRHFRLLTLGHPVIMGRKTYESIGRPLPKRINIVVTRNPSYLAPGCIVAQSLPEALSLAAEHDKDEVFVIGGAEIYRESFEFADRLYLTEIECVDENQTLFGPFPGNTFFPKIDQSVWKIVRNGRKLKASGSELSKFYYRFRIYSRRSGSKAKSIGLSVSSRASTSDAAR
jgi:dihydrofolate reductase